MKNNFEKLNNGIWKKIMIGSTCLVAVLSVGILTTSKAKYRLTDSINIANGTVNYKVPDFKVMAMYTSEDGTNYTEATTMPENGYAINEKKTYCTTDNVNQVKGKIKTVNGEITLKNLTKSDKCYLYFDKIKITDSTSLIANSKINIGSPDFSKTATADEGIYATYDNMYGGQSYYFRGAITNNYVKFANFCWRIVRINGDGSIRLIYDGTTCHANGTKTGESIAQTRVAYNSNYNQSNYTGWTYSETSQRTTGGTASNAKAELESWYSSNITGTNATKVADGKYCNDRNVQSGSTWVINGKAFQYAPSKRIDDATPSLSCPSGDIYTLKVGLITVDEAMFAGGKYEDNTSYYLYNGQNYWTMSPYSWNSTWAIVFIVSNNGYLSSIYGVHVSIGLRPVINLRSNTTFSKGDGTLNNPYTVI